MKYFTRKGVEGRKTEGIRQKYLDNLYAIREQLPVPLRELMFENLQGARLAKLKIDKVNKIIVLRISGQNEELHAFELEITYDTVQLESTDLEVLEARAKDPATQILYDEIDIGETGYTHSFLFTPEDEARITFRTIRMRKK
jgi:hypothetical protein